MRKPFMGAVLALIAVLVFSSVGIAQKAQSQLQGNETPDPWRYYPKNTIVGDGGPAPKHDLSGTWAGPGSSPAVPRGAPPEKPELTPLGQNLMSQNKPI